MKLQGTQFLQWQVTSKAHHWLKCGEYKKTNTLISFEMANDNNKHNKINTHTTNNLKNASCSYKFSST